MEEHYRDMHGTMKVDCRVEDPDGKFLHRYSKLEDAREYLRAHLDMARIKAEVAARGGKR